MYIFYCDHSITDGGGGVIYFPLSIPTRSTLVKKIDSQMPGGECSCVDSKEQRDCHSFA